MNECASGNMRRVVITGIGAVTPIGNTVKEYWQGLLQGNSGAGLITHFDAQQFKTQFACEVKNLELTNHLNHKELRIYDRFTQLGLIAVGEAIQQSALDPLVGKAERMGIIWASGNGGFHSFEEGVTTYIENDRLPRFSPYFIPKLLVNMAGGVIALHHGLKGITFTPVSACASGNSAILEAFYHIKWGHADVMVAGGSDAAITPAGIGGFNASRALSQQNENYLSASRPFDQDRDGFVMGEGAGALVLESLDHALERGAAILAEVGGGGMTSDAYHLTASHPEGEGAQRAMKIAMEQAGVKIDQVDHINAHATSTPLGDLSEAKAIATVFGQHRPKVSATKSMTGHLLGAAAAIEAVAMVETIHHDLIPGTQHTKNIDPEIEPLIDLVLDKPLKQTVNVAISNAFGFGGHNASILFKKYQY